MSQREPKAIRKQDLTGPRHMMEAQDMLPETGYARHGEDHIAYQIIGDGPWPRGVG